MNELNTALYQLLQYATTHLSLDPEEYDYAFNRLLDLLQIDGRVDIEVEECKLEEPSTLLQPILDFAAKTNLLPVDTIKERDIFEAKIMDILIPRPLEINRRFNSFGTPKEQTNYFYNLSKKSNYIKIERTNKNHIWKSETPYGQLDMTINLSKPEKDPKDIILKGKSSDKKYPSCLLCKENVGYNGQSTGIGRTNHRIIPVQLNNEPFYLQYSPYVYYNEHCIVFHKEHIPMNVQKATFIRLFDFVDQFPHYFLGSNAGLPIVGGSILSHEHYQGGRHTFPIEHAKVLSTFTVQSTTFEQLYWPLSVLRLSSKNREELIDFAYKLFLFWEQYSNEEIGIYAYTNNEPHNAITPIARKNGDTYILDMTLRNNRTTEDYPLGLFHPHPEHHHIKKENIGLIEVMGLAVLPARLDEELQLIKDVLQKNIEIPEQIIHHKQWIHYLKTTYSTQDITQFIQDEVALKFISVIEDSGVFKQTPEGITAFTNFTKEVRHVLNR